MITNHTNLLNALIEKYNLKSYLEIGVQRLENNFDKIICIDKTGCDPEGNFARIYSGTSDNFFKELGFTWRRFDNNIFDLIFIDGNHEAKQVRRDFENSLRCLSEHGFIVIHDVLPDEEQYTQIPRSTKKWFGNVYQWAMTLNSYNGIQYKTFNIDCGCCVVWKDPLVKGYPSPLVMNWSLYKSRGRELMNITDTVEI